MGDVVDIRPTDRYAPRITFTGAVEPRHERGFVLGFEMGRLDARLDGKRGSWEGIYHKANEDMIGRVANANGYAFTISEIDETWIGADFVLEGKR